MEVLTADDITLEIDAEFQNLIPPVAEDQQQELAHSVDKYGRFLDPIRYWNSGKSNLIIDGHRRYKLWCGLPDDTPVPPPIVEEMMFPDREAAMEWMELYQLSRRNLSPQAASEIRGRMYNRRKASHGGNRTSPATPNASTNLHKSEKSGKNPMPGASGQIVHLKNDDSIAAQDVAERTGVNARTVRRDGKYVEALDKIGEVNSKAKDDIRSEQLKISRQDVIAIAELPEKEMGKALAKVRKGEDWKPTESNASDEKITKAYQSLIRLLDDRAKEHGTGIKYQGAVNSLKTAFNGWVAWRDAK